LRPTSAFPGWTGAKSPKAAPAGSKIADFQLSYAVDLLDGKVGPKAIAEKGK